MSATDKVSIETLDNNLDTVSESDGTVSFTTLYAFKKDPMELCPPEKSNIIAAGKQAEKTFKKIMKEKPNDGLREIQDMFNRGTKEGNFNIVGNDEAT